MQNKAFVMFLLTLNSSSTFIRDSTFNVSHWIFAMEYFSISRVMPFVVKQTPVPDSQIKCD